MVTTRLLNFQFVMMRNRPLQLLWPQRKCWPLMVPCSTCRCDKLPLEDGSVDFVFLDPPYSTHIEYSDGARCIGKLDAAGDDGGKAYYAAMTKVISECHRVMKNRRYLGLYVSDSWKKKKGAPTGSGAGTFMPIGFELFAMMRELFQPVDIICVARKNSKLESGAFRKGAEDGNFYLRGFNYLMIGKKVDDEAPTPAPAPTKKWKT